MARVTSGGRPPTEIQGETEKTTSPAKSPETGKSSSKISDAQSQRVVDSFQRVAPQLTQRLEAVAERKSLPTIQFTNEHLAQVATMFANLLKNKANASRRERAKMFAKAFLKSRKFGKIFDEADEEDLEKIYELIGDQLEGSPVLAQLVDEVTEGARKLSW